jgi:hypothetical protein
MEWQKLSFSAGIVCNYVSRYLVTVHDNGNLTRHMFEDFMSTFKLIFKKKSQKERDH